MLDEANASVGEVIPPTETPPKEFRDQYWSTVVRTLKEVFDVGSTEDLDRLREKVDEAPAATQTAFYHAEPFDVAADLAGRRGDRVTAEEKQRYVRHILPAQEKPSEAELGRAHPED